MKDWIWDDKTAASSFALRLAREQLWSNQPPARQRETMERVQRLVEEQPNSYLARHWKEIYR